MLMRGRVWGMILRGGCERDTAGEGLEDADEGEGSRGRYRGGIPGPLKQGSMNTEYTLQIQITNKPRPSMYAHYKEAKAGHAFLHHAYI